MALTDSDIAILQAAREGSRNAWFVSPVAGNDSTGTGAWSAPVKTLSKALTIAAADDLIMVGRGVTPLERSTVTMKPGIKVMGAGWNRTFISLGNANGLFLANNNSFVGLSFHGVGIGVNGTPSAVTGISNSGTTATITQTAHGYLTGDAIQIQGASLAANNGIFAITNTGANTYTYTMGSTPGSSPTGSITALLTRLPNSVQYLLTDNSNCDNVWIEDCGFAGVTDCIYTTQLTNIRGRNDRFLTYWDYLVGSSGIFEFENGWADVVGNALGPNPNHLGGVQATNYATVRLKNFTTSLRAVDAFGLPTVTGTGNVSRTTLVFHCDSTSLIELHGGKIAANLPDETYTALKVDPGGSGLLIALDFDYEPARVAGNVVVRNTPINGTGQIAPGAISATANANVVSWGGSTGAVSNDPTSGKPDVNTAFIGGKSAQIFGASGDPTTLTIKNQVNAAIPGAAVWVSSDPIGRVVVAGTAYTDSIGNVTFRLVNGQTYYLWMEKTGEEPKNGEAFIAAKD